MIAMKRNVILLSLCQAIFFSMAAMNIAIGSLVGHALATDKSLATLPPTLTVLGSMIATLPMSLFMQQRGRRIGFILGAAIGLGGCLIAALAIFLSNFWLFLFGMILIGAFAGAAQFFRFAAAELADDAFRARAISWVMVGSLAAGLVGPRLAAFTQDWSAQPFMASYFVMAFLSLLVILLQPVIRFASMRTETIDAAPRPLPQIIFQPGFIAALASGVVGYGAMSYLMTATPVSMVHHHHHAFPDAASVIQWHVVAMFAPSFFTGGLISRFGVRRIILAGIVANGLSLIMANAGHDFPHYLASLVLLGIGWNFMYVAATAWLTQAYRPAEKGRAQGINDLAVTGFSAFSSLMAGVMLQLWGWEILALSALPFLAVVAILIAWERRRTALAQVRIA